MAQWQVAMACSTVCSRSSFRTLATPNSSPRMRCLFPAATIERNGSVDVGVYGVGEENRLIIEVLGAVQLWLNRAPDRTEPVRVRYGNKSYLVGPTA